MLVVTRRLALMIGLLLQLQLQLQLQLGWRSQTQSLCFSL